LNGIGHIIETWEGGARRRLFRMGSVSCDRISLAGE
jgi:hypothetical protein